MKKGFFTFANFVAAVMVMGAIASASDSVLLDPPATTLRADAQPAASESAAPAVAPAAAQTETETPEADFSDEAQDQFKFGGFIYASWYDGFHRMNNPSVALNQTCLYIGRELDTSTYGMDWGYYVEFIFGTEHGQCTDRGFDGGWGVSGDGYGASFNQCYATLGYENLSMKIGKFGTPLGYESSNGTERDLNSTSYMYGFEPSTHCGILATWDVSDRFSLNVGFTTGDSKSFEANGNYGYLFGASYDITERLSIAYEGMINRVSDDDYPKDNQYEHSIIVSWDINCKLNYTFVTNYGSWYSVDNDELDNDYFGIGNYLTYQLTDNMKSVLRYEWVTENGQNNYHELTFGIRHDVNEHLMIRPEIRYDWVSDDESNGSGLSGGIGGAFIF